MGRLLKYSLGLVSALVTLVIVTVVVLLVAVKPEFIKTQITDWVHNNTDRELKIDGTMHWTFFPSIGLRADNVTLSNPKSFDANNFAEAQNMTVSLEIAPLLHKEFAISRLTMNHLVLNLVKNTNGQGNWSFASKKTAATTQEQDSDSNGSNKKASSFEVNLHKIAFKNSTVIYLDKKTGQRTELSKLSLESSNFKPGVPFTIASQFTLNNTSEIALQGKAKFQPENSLLTVKDFELSSSNPKDAMNTFSVYTTGHVNFQKETLQFEPMKFEYAKELSGTATLQGSQIFHQANIGGDIHTNQFNLKQLLDNLGIAVNTVNKKALSSVKIDGKLTVSPQKISVDNMQAKVDDMHLSGDISYQISPSALVVDLAGNDLDVGRYAMQSSESRLNNAAKKLQKQKQASSAGTTIKGSIQFKTVTSGKVRLGNLKTTFNYQNHIATLSPFSANIFSGFTSGSITVNTKGKSTQINLNQSLKNIQIEQLLQQTTGSAKVSGRANIQAKLNFASAAVQKTLSGSANISSNSGIIRGVDIDHTFAKQLAKVGGSAPTHADRGYTPYQQLSANVSFGGGILNNQSLSLDLENYHIKGDGKLNMTNRGLDYNLGIKPKKATEVKTQIGSTDLSQYYIPLRVTGTTNNPNINLDFNEVLKLTIKKQAEQLLKKQVTDKLQDKIKEKINDGSLGDALKKALPF